MGIRLGEATLEGYARSALAGVGNAALGEWTEWTGYGFHVRRRLTAAEMAPIGPVVDIRGTTEALERFHRVEKYLPPELREPL